MSFGLRNPFMQFDVTDTRAAAGQAMSSASQTAGAMEKKIEMVKPKKSFGMGLMTAASGAISGMMMGGPAGAAAGAGAGFASYYLS